MPLSVGAHAGYTEYGRRQRRRCGLLHLSCHSRKARRLIESSCDRSRWVRYWSSSRRAWRSTVSETNYVDGRSQTNCRSGRQTARGCWSRRYNVGANYVRMQGDSANANGEIRRTAVMDAVLSECAELAPLLACQWQAATDIQILVEEDGRRAYERHTVTKGVWQGSALSNPAFCMPLMKALRRTVGAFNADRGPENKVTLLAYADDFVLIAPRGHDLGTGGGGTA